MAQRARKDGIRDVQPGAQGREVVGDGGHLEVMKMEEVVAWPRSA
jgi:hypothetical protein